MNSPTPPITPIFIFSLPRSGSTLMQRMLATHPAVATASEPWILIPFLYAGRREGIYAEYGHRVAFKAMEDFCAELPGGPSVYLDEIKKLVLRLYARRANANARYFVDKTPRYHVVSAEIMSLFDEAQFIFLWRNPLAIISSIIETWGKGGWNLYEFEFDMFDGLEQLVSTCRDAGDRAISVRYEDLVAEGPETREGLFRHLGLIFDESQMHQFSNVTLTGRMGDQTGRRMYSALTQEPTEKWRRVLASPVRKWWCRRYLRWIGRDRLGVMGYDWDALMRELDSIPSRPTAAFSDILSMLFGLVVRTCEPWIMRDKLARLRCGKRLYAHS